MKDGRVPDTTQESLLVAGQALLGGVLTRRVPTKDFRIVGFHFIPLSQAELGAISSSEEPKPFYISDFSDSPRRIEADLS